MKTTFRFALLVSVLLGLSLQGEDLVGPSKATGPYAIDHKLDGPQSMYTEKMLQQTKDLVAARAFCKSETAPLGIHMIGTKTKDRPYYVVFKKCMTINAPLFQVEAVKDDVDHYGDLFPGFKEVKVTEKKGNFMVISWEKEIPVFFVPNIKYEINYIHTKPNLNSHLYRLQFKKGDRLKFNDGLEILQADGPNKTLFTNFEFYEADYDVGLLGMKAASSETVWKESYKGGYISLLSIRMKSEHPDWGYKKVAEEREKAIKNIDFEAIPFDN